jgi:endonuclease G
MPRYDADRLKRYLQMITVNDGGLEAEQQELTQARNRGGLESADPNTDLARTALEEFLRNRTPSDRQMMGMEAIIDAKWRPVFDIIDGTFSAGHPKWRHLSDNAQVKSLIERAIPSIGRIELPGDPQYPYGGTGFVVGNGLVMTNRHVAEIFAHGIGDRRLTFIADRHAGINFTHEQGRPPGMTFNVVKVRMIHPYWDMALLEVEGLPANHTPLNLSVRDARDLPRNEIFIVGYPAFDGRNPTDVQDQLFDGRFGVKRLQPGLLQGGYRTGSYGKLVDSATHDCSTLGGNSGAAVIDLRSGEVMGLHFGGLYQDRNYCVPSFELARDQRVIDAGVRFAGNPPDGANDWTSWWQIADGDEGPGGGDRNGSGTSTAPAGTSAPVTASTAIPMSASGGAITVEIPLRITVSLGTAQGASAVAGRTEAVAADVLERMVEPWRDQNYRARKGYDPDFLNTAEETLPISVPMPKPANPAVLAQAYDGKDVLRYEHFSVSIHAKRRLALVTAANVTADRTLRRPGGRTYTRAELSGLGTSDQERWFLDPRLDPRFQLPDVFFTKDRKAFDKGHIVRRDDVAWGTTFEELRRANGDSYHVTNCSPQVKAFNQSAQGKDNWGDLENHVLSEAKSERLCVLAGPVLDPADEVFVGVGDDRTVLRAKIPSRFWKIVVARVTDGVASFGFVLEQDLGDVSFEEFAVPKNFAKTMCPIADIEAMAGIVFPDAVRDSDQYDTVRGAGVAMRTGARTRRRRH